MGPPSLSEWLTAFRKLHAKAAKGQLTPSDGVNYYRGRNELARLLFGLQQLTLQPGQIPRQWIRVSHPLQVDIEFNSTRIQALTLDVCLGGFGTILNREPAVSELVRYVLHLPSVAPLAGQARVMEMRPTEAELLRFRSRLRKPPLLAAAHRWENTESPLFPTLLAAGRCSASPLGADRTVCCPWPIVTGGG